MRFEEFMRSIMGRNDPHTTTVITWLSALRLRPHPGRLPHVADLESRECAGAVQLAEAIQYRSLDRTFR